MRVFQEGLGREEEEGRRRGKGEGNEIIIIKRKEKKRKEKKRKEKNRKERGKKQEKSNYMQIHQKNSHSLSQISIQKRERERE